MNLAREQKRDQVRLPSSDCRPHEIVVFDETAAVRDVFGERSSPLHHSPPIHAFSVGDTLVFRISFGTIKLNKFQKVSAVLRLIYPQNTIINMTRSLRISTKGE